MPMENYLELNRSNWNDRAEAHFGSDFYDVKGFLEGKSSLNGPELSLLGDVMGKRVLHLQCHFGQDTLSLARMGAVATGVDFSEKAISLAHALSEKAGVDARFVCSDIYSLPSVLDEKYDIVFTSYGTIGWLPDLDKWAAVITHFLRTGGRFVMVDFHPALWMWDDHFKDIAYSYFNVEPIVESVSGTYTDKDTSIKGQNISWNHSTSELLNALIKNGLHLEVYNEYDYSPYNCFNETVEDEPGIFRIKRFGNKLPMMYSLRAAKV